MTTRKRATSVAPRRADSPVLDSETRLRRAVLKTMARMSSRGLFRTMVDVGIYTADGALTPEYGGARQA